MSKALNELIEKWCEPMRNYAGDERMEHSYDATKLACAQELRAALPVIEAERKELKELVEALRVLYEETAEYITINHLGDVHHNRSMQMARDILARVKEAQP